MSRRRKWQFWHRILQKAPQTEQQRLGRAGERAAAQHLRKAGLRVVARNWRHGHDEIDLVCRDGAFLVFVEVRTRANDALVSGLHSITVRKKAALLRVCRSYLAGLRTPPAHFRFDVVDVRHLGKGDFVVTHHANLALFPKHFHANR